MNTGTNINKENVNIKVQSGKGIKLKTVYD